jgi:hypothetical protein
VVMVNILFVQKKEIAYLLIHVNNLQKEGCYSGKCRSVGEMLAVTNQMSSSAVSLSAI